jgi:hypothetical protein
VHDVVEHFANAEDALGDEGAVGPFQPIKCDVPKRRVPVDEDKPKRKALLEKR